MQPAWAHVQSMSGIFSMASHCALQYLPEVVMHEQTGCAHFLAVSLVISVLLASNQDRVAQFRILRERQEAFLCQNEHP